MSALDLRPPLSVYFSAMGVAATVTPKGGSPVATSVVWAGPEAGPDFGSLVQRGMDQVPNLRPRLAVRRDEVAALPVGSVISAPALAGGTPRLWTVERVDDLDPEVFDVVVEPV